MFMCKYFSFGRVILKTGVTVIMNILINKVY